MVLLHTEITGLMMMPISLDQAKVLCSTPEAIPMCDNIFMMSTNLTECLLCSVWRMQLVATVRSEQAVHHIAWSPYNSCQAAFICEDGSLHLLAVSQQSPAGSPSLSVEVSMMLHLHSARYAWSKSKMNGWQQYSTHMQKRKGQIWRDIRLAQQQMSYK